MKAFNLAALALLSVLGVAVARANLGETEAQCVAKYGNESEIKNDLGFNTVGDRAVTFYFKTASSSLSLRVVFLQGTVAHEEIASADHSQPLSEAQMKSLLDAESAGLKWRKRNSRFHTDNAGSTSGLENWSRSDDEAVAKFWVTGKAGSHDLTGQMELATKKFADAQAFYDKQYGGN